MSNTYTRTEWQKLCEIVILIDSVDALRSVPTGVRHTLIDVDLAVWAGCAGSATTLVTIDQVLTRTTVLAGSGRTFVQLVLTQKSRVTRMAGARERVLAVDAFTMLAWVRQTIVDVVFTVETREARRTLALVTGYRVMTYATVFARAAHTVIDVGLAPRPGEPCRTRAFVPIDHICANTAVLARVRFTLIHVNLTLRARKPCVKSRSLLVI